MQRERNGLLFSESSHIVRQPTDIAIGSTVPVTGVQTGAEGAFAPKLLKNRAIVM